MTWLMGRALLVPFCLGKIMREWSFSPRPTGAAAGELEPGPVARDQTAIDLADQVQAGGWWPGRAPCRAAE